MLENLINILSNLPKELVVFILGMMPVSELRGAIPFGVAVGIPVRKVLFLAIVGNIVPVIPLLFLLEPLSNYLRRFPPFKIFFDWLFERTRRRAAIVEKYEGKSFVSVEYFMDFNRFGTSSYLENDTKVFTPHYSTPAYHQEDIELFTRIIL